MTITEISHLLGFLLCTSLIMAQENIEGVCLTGPPKPIDNSALVDIKQIGAEWVCLLPYAYGPDKDGNIIHNNIEWQWWGERESGIRELIRMAKSQKMKVMVKPHLWLAHGKFTGTFDLGSEEAWKLFEDSYAEYLLRFAKVAEEEGVELFCIGTELEKFVLERTRFWNQLIDKVSNIYSGKLTYAANWDEVYDFPLWSRLDYVGVDGYFPIANNAMSTQVEMTKAWEQHIQKLDQLCLQVDRRLLFCEIGYRSCVDCATKPWEHDNNREVDHTCQENAYRAFFSAINSSDTYAGSFLWKWHSGTGWEKRRSADFTPQGKPVLSIVKQQFKAP